MNNITAGQLRDLLSCAHTVISLSDGADEHSQLIAELHEALELMSGEIEASHMGTGRDVVLIERGDVA